MLQEKSPIRSLAISFGKAELTMEEYRRERALLLRSITETEKFVKVRNGSSRKAKRRFLPLFAFGLAGVLILAVGLILWGGDGGKREEEKKGVPVLSQTKSVTAPSTSIESIEPDSLVDNALDAEGISVRWPQTAEGLVDLFLERGDWSSGAVSSFRERWDLLPPQERQKAAGASWYIEFGEMLKVYLDAQRERALRYGGGGDYSYLKAFAESLGFEAKRPGVREAPEARKKEVQSISETIAGAKEKEVGRLEKKTMDVTAKKDAVMEEKKAEVLELPETDVGDVLAWDTPEVIKVGAGRFVVAVSFSAGEEMVHALVRENLELDLRPFRMDFAQNTYMLQKEFSQRQEAVQFSDTIEKILLNLHK